MKKARNRSKKKLIKNGRSWKAKTELEKQKQGLELEREEKMRRIIRELKKLRKGVESLN